MLFKVFFIILAVFLFYYFGFYEKTKNKIVENSSSQNHQFWQAKEIDFQILLGDNQYFLKANSAKVLDKNKKKYFIQMPEFSIREGWSIQAQQALLEDKNLELFKNIRGEWENYLLLAKKINIQLDKKETRLQGDFYIINNKEQTGASRKAIKLTSKDALLKKNKVVFPKKIMIQFGKNTLQADEGFLEKNKFHFKGNIIAQLETSKLRADEGFLEKNKFHFKGNIIAQLETSELQADEGFLEKNKLHFKGNVVIQSEKIEIRSQEMLYLPTAKTLQSQMPFLFIKKGEDINIKGDSFLYNIAKESLQLKK